MSRWLQVAVPLGLAVISPLVMEPRNWGDIRQGTMMALSVLGAAVFVRLARGMPITNTDFFEVQEIRDLSFAVKIVMRRMIALIILAFMSIIGLNFIELFLKAASSLTVGLEAKGVISGLISGVLTFLVAFTLARAVNVVRGDYDLVELQSTLMIRAVERKHAKEVAARLDEADKASPFMPREGYGRQIQH
ncbi:hypothetical protein [Magnetospirillum fulvum]|uniref:Uncharacterized protein n=1 Tax=Magnetospirillum fulvum MGU-K5 TaxID=1316936 RepID=S9SB86_MAGFU|nr:hypothetical protein [Magnetospirillum fulvum]EPY01358.1 hypothetical protein K678_11191 [Magnetospirillum fulvum MGU-K5]